MRQDSCQSIPVGGVQLVYRLVNGTEHTLEHWLNFLLVFHMSCTSPNRWHHDVGWIYKLTQELNWHALDASPYDNRICKLSLIGLFVLYDYRENRKSNEITGGPVWHDAADCIPYAASVQSMRLTTANEVMCESKCEDLQMNSTTCLEQNDQCELTACPTQYTTRVVWFRGVSLVSLELWHLCVYPCFLGSV